MASSKNSAVAGVFGGEIVVATSKTLTNALRTKVAWETASLIDPSYRDHAPLAWMILETIWRPAKVTRDTALLWASGEKRLKYTWTGPVSVVVRLSKSCARRESTHEDINCFAILESEGTEVTIRGGVKIFTSEAEESYGGYKMVKISPNLFASLEKWSAEELTAEDEDDTEEEDGQESYAEGRQQHCRCQ